MFVQLIDSLRRGWTAFATIYRKVDGFHAADPLGETVEVSCPSLDEDEVISGGTLCQCEYHKDAGWVVTSVALRD